MKHLKVYESFPLQKISDVDIEIIKSMSQELLDDMSLTKREVNIHVNNSSGTTMLKDIELEIIIRCLDKYTYDKFILVELDYKPFQVGKYLITIQKELSDFIQELERKYTVINQNQRVINLRHVYVISLKLKLKP
jgi:hypothetical protein